MRADPWKHGLISGRFPPRRRSPAHIMGRVRTTRTTLLEGQTNTKTHQRRVGGGELDVQGWRMIDGRDAGGDRFWPSRCVWFGTPFSGMADGPAILGHGSSHRPVPASRRRPGDDPCDRLFRALALEPWQRPAVRGPIRAGPTSFLLNTSRARSCAGAGARTLQPASLRHARVGRGGGPRQRRVGIRRDVVGVRTTGDGLGGLRAPGRP